MSAIASKTERGVAMGRPRQADPKDGVVVVKAVEVPMVMSWDSLGIPTELTHMTRRQGNTFHMVLHRKASPHNLKGELETILPEI